MAEPLPTIDEYLAGGAAARRDALRRLAQSGDAASLARFAELVCRAAPESLEDVLVAFSPLFQQPDRTQFAALFPRLLDALDQPSVAAIILDMANFAARRGLLGKHPAGDRSAALAKLFASVVDRLARLETQQPQSPAAHAEYRRQAEEGFALFVSLADALALIGDRAAAGPLRGGLAISHRRLRTEAAAALARLGDDEGIAQLVQLAQEPVVRNRAIAYLAELNLAERVPAELRTPEATAEGQLAQWLAAPAQFGVAPQAISSIDRRRLAWPGFAEPVECFLFRYDYRAAGSEFHGVGIVGPMTNTLTCDVDRLSPEDVYAIFAGWQTEHEAIRETPLEELDAEERERALEVCEEFGAGYSHVRPIKVGDFFGRQQIVAAALWEGEPGTVVIDAAVPHWYPAGNPNRPLGAAEAYNLHKGRELLRAFNRLEA